MNKPRSGNYAALAPTPLREYAVAILCTAAVSVLSLMLEPLIGHEAIGLLYLLLVVAVGVKLRRGPVLLVAACSAVMWDWLFLPPYFNLHIASGEDLMLFATFFVVALIFFCGTVAPHGQEKVPAAQNAARFEIPPTDEGWPGAGPIRRMDWFKRLWAERRAKWAEKVRHR